MEINSEIWHPVHVDDFQYAYQVSNLGGVKSTERYIAQTGKPPRILREKILKPRRGKQIISIGFRTLGGPKYFSVAYLVAGAFLPNPYNYQFIRHLDGNPLNVKASNLEWSSKKCAKWEIA
jgi:hypothetical protein